MLHCAVRCLKIKILTEHYIILYIFYIGAVQLRDHDNLKLQVLGARNGWLACVDTVCDLRHCSSSSNNHCYFNGRRGGEEFQIIGEGAPHDPIKYGQ